MEKKKKIMNYKDAIYQLIALMKINQKLKLKIEMKQFFILNIIILTQ